MWSQTRNRYLRAVFICGFFLLRLTVIITATNVEYRLPHLNHPSVPFENSKKRAVPTAVHLLDHNNIHHSVESANAPYLINHKLPTIEPPTEKIMVSETRSPWQQGLVDKALDTVMNDNHQAQLQDSPKNNSSYASTVYEKQQGDNMHKPPTSTWADKSEIRRQLNDTLQQVRELQRRLAESEETLAMIKETSRVIENGNSALRLENSQNGRLYGEERVKGRQLKAELLELKQCAAEANSTHYENATDSWDVHETIYNGERWIRNWDGRAERESERKVTAARILIFVRHGHYEYSIPEEHITMSELGKKQMDAAGTGLAALNFNWTRKLVVSSKLRTIQAANIIASKMPGVFDIAPTELIWSCTYDNDSARRQEAFKEIMHRASPEQKETSLELIVTHSSIIRYFLERALQVPVMTIDLPLVHGSFTRVEIPPDGQVLLRHFGEYSHMPRELLTNSNAKWVPGGSLPELF